MARPHRVARARERYMNGCIDVQAKHLGMIGREFRGSCVGREPEIGAVCTRPGRGESESGCLARANRKRAGRFGRKKRSRVRGKNAIAGVQSVVQNDTESWLTTGIESALGTGIPSFSVSLMSVRAMARN